MSASVPALKPGATVGILGGGQLGRMLAMAAADLGLKAHVFCTRPDDPALDVARHSTIGEYDDEAALALFADSVDVATYEFENIPRQAAELVAAHGALLPNVEVLATTQDRLYEKQALRSLGIPIAAFASVTDRASLAAGIGAVGRPAILKTRRFGYDGKGQVTVREGLALDSALSMLGGQEAVLEAFVPFRIEFSVLAARGRDGQFVAYDVCENRHAHHVLRSSHLPANLSPELAAEAVALARRFAEGFDYVGVFAMEMFAVQQPGEPERILANEIAPRVHNSGHWTLEGAETSQFEQHIRAIAGWPLGSARRLGRIEMQNLLGDDANSWPDILATSGAHLHLYGKAEPRPGRKMGHVTFVHPEG